MRFSHAFAASAATVLAALASAQPLYTVTDLGHHPDYTFSTVALSINNPGQVVGWVQQSLTRAFVWTVATGIQLLPPVPGNEDRSSVAVDINDRGEILGYSGAAGGSNIVAWVYRNGAYTFLGSLPGYGSVTPAAINNNAEVVGTCSPATSTSPSQDFYWSPATGIIDMVPGAVVEPHDINDAGVVTGGIRGGEPAPGIMTWDMRTGAAADLGKLFGGDINLGYAINETGWVAGVSIEVIGSTGRIPHGVLATPSFIQDFGQFHSTATGINERGDIVGWRTNGPNSSWYSWVYLSGQALITDLHAVIDDPALYTRVSAARAINDRGQILADSARASGPDPLRRSIVLTPIGLPPACGTADFDNDGDSGTDADIEAFFACLAGNCCTACGSADFNGDGDIGTDADIESFFRVLAGGNC